MVLGIGTKFTAIEYHIAMPASKFTKKATTPKLARQWEHVRRSAEEKGEGPGAAIRMASGTVKRSAKKRSKR